jgi:hypothetical protein
VTPRPKVTFPVSRKVPLIGYPDAREARCIATDQIVAHVNSRTLHLSGGVVFQRTTTSCLDVAA